MKWQRPRITKTILKEKNKAGELSVLDSKTYYKSRVVKTIWYWDLGPVDDATLMAESKEELKSLLIRVKEEKEKTTENSILKNNLRSWHQVPLLLGQ